MSNSKTFPGFEHPASLIKRYACTIGIFTMLLTDGNIISFEPKDTEGFRQWLNDHNVKDMKTEQ
jgi:hypothetical protein